jgi:hypothetical protein
MFRLKLIPVDGQPNAFKKEFVGNPIDEFSEIFDRFFSLYNIRILLADDEFHKRPLVAKEQRVCRFCKATFCEEEKFRSLAHLLPELIGNKNLLSDSECDKCNNLFGKYENHLANFLGASRVINMENVRTGSLKFKSPDKTFLIQKDKKSEAPKLNFESHEEENNHFTLDPENKKITFHTTRPSYNPHLVWKSFLKMGLSVLPDEYIDDYELAFAVLRSERKNEEGDNPLYKMNMYQHAGPPFPSPMIVLFEKIDKSMPVPMHVACIMFHNYAYQLVLPFCKRDKLLYNGETIITIPNMPPFIDKHFANRFGVPKSHRLNFNLDELKKNEKHDMSFTFDSYTDTRFTES